MNAEAIVEQAARRLTRIKDNVITQCLTNALGPDWDFESLQGRLSFRQEKHWGKEQTIYFLDNRELVTFSLPRQPIEFGASLNFTLQYETPYWRSA